MSQATSARPHGWLDEETRRRLADRIRVGLRRARAKGRAALVGVTCEVTESIDPVAVAAGSRRPGERWFCIEQPARGGSALAALGCAWELVAPRDAPDRFRGVDEAWRRVTADALADPPEGPAGSGLVAVGGFAFAPGGGSAPHWREFGDRSLLVPEVSIARGAGGVWLSVNVQVQPDDTNELLLERVEHRLLELRELPLPLLDPSPTGPFRVLSTMPPAQYEGAVERAKALIAQRRVEKVVVAREVEVHAPAEHDAPALLGVLREAFGSCYVFAVGRGDATLIGASPELLVRKEGQRATTVALAGSTGRSADPAVDDHLGERLLRSDKDREENAIVVKRIAQALSKRSLWVTAAAEPTLVRVANIQHLATPIRAQLASAAGALELVGLLHPTPAVGGEPVDAAMELIPALEGLDRGWYAGPIGFIDATGDGEFCVALRCALLRGRVARCYAGCGIVRGSDPASELAETEVKLEALLPLLAGS